jgi:glutaredoxin
MFCQRTKEFLSQKGMQFQDRNVTTDPSAFEELNRLHAMTTPVTLIGEAVIIGFDQEKIEEALAKLPSKEGKDRP